MVNKAIVMATAEGIVHIRNFVAIILKIFLSFQNYFSKSDSPAVFGNLTFWNFPTIQYMWPDLPKPATYAHNGKEHFSSPIDSFINKPTNCHNTPPDAFMM